LTFVAAEGGGGILKRVRAFRQHHGVTDDDDCPISMIRHSIDLRDPRTAEDLITCWIALANPDLLVIDTWSRFLPGGNESSTEDTTAAIATLDAFRHETGCPVVVVHHSPLADNQRPRGSTALIAAADVALAVDRVGDLRVAKLMKNRDGEAESPGGRAARGRMQASPESTLPYHSRRSAPRPSRKSVKPVSFSPPMAQGISTARVSSRMGG
jgi:hypothetical protein